MENSDLSAMAGAVEARVAALALPEEKPRPDMEFVRNCLHANERGDGALYALLHRENFLYNTTPKEGEWLRWEGVTWTVDDTRRSVEGVEDVALEYQALLDEIEYQITADGIEPKDDQQGLHKLVKKLVGRLDRLRGESGVKRVLYWAPVVDPGLNCRDDAFDQHPWLLPCKNGVINLQTGVLEKGRPADMLTRALDLDYDPHADYGPWVALLDEITGDPEVTAFLKRSFGYAVTGFASEQYFWVFTGPGRNGKGIVFSLLGSVLGPYYHEINRGMILEQRNEPSPAATSEHKYSLLGKRVIVAAETNKNQRVDMSAVKSLTGEDRITCRPLFKGEVSFLPTHTLFLHTNHIPIGMTKDFAMIQRILKVEFPYMFVDDIEAEKKKSPGQADRFRQKDPFLKEKLKPYRPGILRWLVEGCLEWQQVGLAPPLSVLHAVDELARQEDYIGQFMADCLVHLPDDPTQRLGCTDMYNAFKWWWSENMDTRDQRIPAMKSINSAIRDRGYRVEKSGGKTWIYSHWLNPDITKEVTDFINKGAKVC